MKCPTLFSMVFISNHSVLGAESLLFWACDYAEKANRTQESSDTVACADTIHDVWNAILGICSWKHFLPQNENGPPFAHCGRPHKTTSTQKPVTKKKKKTWMPEHQPWHTWHLTQPFCPLKLTRALKYLLSGCFGAVWKCLCSCSSLAQENEIVWKLCIMCRCLTCYHVIERYEGMRAVRIACGKTRQREPKGGHAQAQHQACMLHSVASTFLLMYPSCQWSYLYNSLRKSCFSK